MKKAFTLVEMLVVIGIISVLISVSIVSFSKMRKSADRARAQELVSNASTALTALFNADGFWPKRICDEGKTEGKLDANIAIILAKRGFFSLTYSGNKLIGNDRFGIVTPWAQAAIKRAGAGAAVGTKVSDSSTVEDHILRFAVDLDGDGLIEGAKVGGESVDIRATAAVWCCGRDGKILAYSRGVRGDCAYSWSRGQTQAVK